MKQQQGKMTAGSTYVSHKQENLQTWAAGRLSKHHLDFYQSTPVQS